MKKKILFLSPLPPPHYGSAMSSEMCLQILKESKKFEIINIKLNYSNNMKDIGKFSLNKILGFFNVIKKIKYSLKKFKPDLIYFVPATSSLGFRRDFLFWKQIRRFYSGKVIFHFRSRILEEDWKRKSFKRKLKKMIKNQNSIVLGKELVQDMHKIIPEEKIFVLPNAIENTVYEKDFAKITKKRKKINEFNLLFLSNMNLSKGWLKLLKACKILRDKKIDFHCNFVGDFPSSKEKKLFFNFLKENDLSKYVSYLGKKTGKEKDKMLEKSNILIFPTEYPLETFGRVTIEGMMFGLPIIANGIAAIPSIIEDKKTGFVLKTNSPKEIAEKINELNNKNLCEKFGKAGRKRFLENYTVEKYRKKFLKIIESV